MNTTQNMRYYISEYTETEQTALTTILGIVMTLSLYGNCGMLIVLYKNDKMWNSTNILIGNLAITGVLVTVLTMPFSLISMVLTRWPFKDGPVCKFNGFVNSILLLATIFIHTLISIDKYYSVVKPFRRTMTVKRTWRIMCLVFIIAILMSTGPLLNFGQYTYNHTSLVCGVGFPRCGVDSVYMLLLFFIGFFIPNTASFYVYIKVFFAVKSHSRRLRETCASHCSLDVVKLQKRLIYTSMLSLLCFLFCWTPFAVYLTMGLITKSIENVPHGLGVSAYWCGYFYNAINPLVICSMSNRFGEGLYEITMSVSKWPFRAISVCYIRCVIGTDQKEDSEQSNFTDLSTHSNFAENANGNLSYVNNTVIRNVLAETHVPANSTFINENGKMASTANIILNGNKLSN